MRDEDIIEIINNHKTKTLINYNYSDYIKTNYTFKSRTKNYIYYRCNIRNKSNSTGRIDIDNKKFTITNKCNEEIEHTTIDYEEFAEKLKGNNYKDIDFKKLKFKKYFVIYSLIENNNIDNAILKKNFYSLTKLNLNLPISQLSKIRHNTIDNFNELTLDNLLK